MIYDGLAPYYDILLSPLERLCLKKWRADAASSLPKIGRILEIGSGTGLNFQYFSDLQEVVATEPSKQMFQRSLKRRFNGFMLRADACHIPFKDDSFAGAFGTLVFCSIENPSTAINELKRVVRHEGRIVLLEHVRPKEPLGTLFDLINFFSVRLIKDHFNRRTAEILYEHGLRIEEIRSHAGGIINIIVCGNLKPTITDG